MANVTDRTDKFFVAKVSKRDNSVQYLRAVSSLGSLNFGPEMEGGQFDTMPKANKISSWLNNIYGELGMEVYCYPVSSAETNNHIITNAPEEYQAIVRAHFNVDAPVEGEPV